MYLSLVKICFLLLALSDQFNKLAAREEKIYDFDTWAKVYPKKYATSEEKAQRQKIYNQNVELIRKHNSEADAGLHTWYKGVNQFTDLTDEEYAKGFEYVKDIFAKFNLTKPDMSQSNQVKSSSRSVSAPAVPPANFDWRTQPQNIVNPIRDQGTSTVDLSGAFSGIAAIESAFALKAGTLPQLSEQQSLGCSLGFVSPLSTIIHGQVVGVPSRSAVPYTGSTAYNCPYSPKYPENWGYLTAISSAFENDRLKNMIRTYGLIPIAIEASKLQSYSSGIIPDTLPTTSQYTYANIVGWATTGQGAPYWILRYSRGTNWGESGYFRIAMTTTGVSWFVYSPKFLAHYYQ